MGDVSPRLGADEMAELSALADGSLVAERRTEVEARISASPELAELLDRQRCAVSAIRSAADEPVPASLRERVEALRPSRSRRWLVPRLALGAAGLVAVAAVAVLLALSGGAAQPTVADAARLATKAPTGPAPRRLDGDAATLAAGIAGVTFPDLRRAYGWAPAGVRSGRLDGHDVLVVLYSKGARRLSYAVVAGDPLGGVSGYPRSRYRGIEFRSFSVDGRPAVTWTRNGHTCVLTGGASRSELLALASWYPPRTRG